MDWIKAGKWMMRLRFPATSIQIFDPLTPQVPSFSRQISPIFHNCMPFQRYKLQRKNAYTKICWWRGEGSRDLISVGTKCAGEHSSGKLVFLFPGRCTVGQK